MSIRLAYALKVICPITVALVLIGAPLLASCEDETVKNVNSNADDYDQGVKVDKQYDEQQDQQRNNTTTNCEPQSALDVAQPQQASLVLPLAASPRILLADYVLPTDLQLAWGSGGGGNGGSGGNGGKGPPKNCP